MRTTIRFAVFAPLALLVAHCSSSSPDESSANLSADAVTSEPSTIWVWVNGSARAMSFENEYIPGVVSCESGVTCSIHGGLSAYACKEQLKAQAVAARTYALKEMEDRPGLGTANNPVFGDARFQCWQSGANATAHAAASETAGVVMSYGGDYIYANFDSGCESFDANGNPLPPTAFGYPWRSWDAARVVLRGRSGMRRSLRARQWLRRDRVDAGVHHRHEPRAVGRQRSSDLPSVVEQP